MADNQEFQRWKVTEPYLNIHCGLGEAPYHEVDLNQLRFLDIKKHRLHVFNLSDGPSSLKTLQLDMPVGVTADIEGVDPSKKILVGGKTGLAVLDRETGKYEYLTHFYDSREGDERLRSNDGTVDCEGRFWIGTMNDFNVGEPQAERDITTSFFFLNLCKTSFMFLDWYGPVFTKLSTRYYSVLEIHVSMSLGS
jgi:sugar lactone lactonase YvrE